MFLLALYLFFRTKTPDASGFKLIKPQRQRTTNQVLIQHQKPCRLAHQSSDETKNKPPNEITGQSPYRARRLVKQQKNRSHDSLAIAYTCTSRCWAVLISSASLRLPNGLHCCKRRLHLKMILAGCVGKVPSIVSLFLVSHMDQRSAPTQLHTTRFVGPCNAAKM